MPTNSTDPHRFDTPWRRMAAALFASPDDARMSATIEIDVTVALDYVRDGRPPGVRLGLIHLLGAAVARTIEAEVPELNTYLSRGRVRPKTSLDIVLTVKVPRREALTEVRVSNAHLLPARGFAEAVHAALGRLRTDEGLRSLDRSYLLARFPWLLRRPIFRGLRGIASGLGLPIRGLDLAPESFGAVILSEVGRFRPRGDEVDTWGHTVAIDGPLMPAAQGTSVAWLLDARARPVVHGDEILVRTLAPFSITADHRLVDGHHFGMFFAGVAKRMQDPEALDTPR